MPSFDKKSLKLLPACAASNNADTFKLEVRALEGVKPELPQHSAPISRMEPRLRKKLVDGVTIGLATD